MEHIRANLHDGQSPPLAIITPTNQSGVLLIAAGLGLAFALISLLIRIYLRVEVRHSISPDDVAIIVAIVLAIAQVGTISSAASNGFGESIAELPSASLIPIQKALYASDILYLVIIWLAKCSVAFLTLRLSSLQSHSGLSIGTLVVATIFMLVSVFLVALRCNLHEPWQSLGAQCGDILPRWRVIAVFDTITEVALFAIPVYLVSGLQLSREKKATVIFAFALRLPVISFIFLRLHYLPNQLSGIDPTLQGVTAAVFTQLQISYSIFAATTPCLRPFMSALNTHYGAPAQARTPTATKVSANSYALSNLSKTSKNGGQNKGNQLGGPITRWDKAEHRTSVKAGDSHSVESNSSKRMIISKDTRWDIDYEGQDTSHT